MESRESERERDRRKEREKERERLRVREEEGGRKGVCRQAGRRSGRRRRRRGGVRRRIITVRVVTHGDCTLTMEDLREITSRFCFTKLYMRIKKNNSKHNTSIK